MIDYNKKAQELIEKVSPHIQYWDCYNDEPISDEESLDICKKLVYILIDEIIESNPTYPAEGYFETYLDRIEAATENWRQIKQTVENMTHIKPLEESELIRIALYAIRKRMDFETLKYCDELYGKEYEAINVWDYVEEYDTIGRTAFEEKYQQHI